MEYSLLLGFLLELLLSHERAHGSLDLGMMDVAPGARRRFRADDGCSSMRGAMVNLACDTRESHIRRNRDDLANWPITRQHNEDFHVRVAGEILDPDIGNTVCCRDSVIVLVISCVRKKRRAVLCTVNKVL